jgi:fucose 4-O-acetylase-like acetyltransferase
MAAQVANLGSAEPQPALPGPLARSRLVYVDNLRTVLISAVVLGHISGSYGVEADWVYREGGQSSDLVSGLGLMAMIIGASFAIGLFFLLAGYFTPPAYDRKGARRFLLDRLKKLGIPWLIFEVVINPLIHYAIDVHGGDCRGALYDCQYQGTFWDYLKAFPRSSGSFGDGPVWFLEALLIFSIFYMVWRLVAERALWPTPRELGASPAVPGNATIALFALAIGLSSFVLRFWVKAFTQYEPFHLEFARFPQYIAMFVAGVWAYRRGWLAVLPQRRASTWRWVTLVCVLMLPLIAVAGGALEGIVDERMFGGMNWRSLVYSLWEGFLCVSMSISLLSWFQRRFDRQGRLARAMSESAFAVYILHPAIIVPLALALSGLRMHLSLKLLFVAPIAVALCYLVVYGLRMVRPVRSIFG